MNRSEYLRIIKNYEAKLNYNDNWIVSSPEPPTQEETEEYDRACSEIYGQLVDENITNIEYNIWRCQYEIDHKSNINKETCKNNINKWNAELKRMKQYKKDGFIRVPIYVHKIEF